MEQEGHAEVEGRQGSHEETGMKRGRGGREGNPLFDSTLGSRIDDICRTNFSLLHFLFFNKERQTGDEL